jgi:hypothetical protein
VEPALAPEPVTAEIFRRLAVFRAGYAGLVALEGRFHEVFLGPDGRGGADEGEGQSEEGETHDRVVFKMGCLLGGGTAAGIASVGCVAKLCCLLYASKGPEMLPASPRGPNSIIHGMMSMSPPGMEAVSSKVVKVFWVNMCCLLVLDLRSGSRK